MQYYLLYILSISLQISGAILLMFNVLSTQRDKVIRRFSGNGLIFKSDENGKAIIDYNKEFYKSTFKEAYLSKFAFFFIIVGYLLSIFTVSLNSHLLEVTFLIIYLSVLFIGVSYLIVDFILKRSKKVNRDISENDLDRLGIKPDFEEISGEDISSLME